MKNIEKFDIKHKINRLNNLSDEEKDKIYSKNFAFAQKVLNRVKNYVSFENRKVLDIGSSHGEYLANFSTKSVGIECRSNLYELSKNLGLNVLNLNVEDSLMNIKEKFDMVFCRQVLDHLVSPHKFLIEAHSLLNKRGQILLSIDNIHYIHGFKLPSEHLYGFCRESLEIAVQKAGFKILKLFTIMSNKPLFIENLFNKFNFLLGRSQDLYILAEKIENYTYPSKRIPEFTPSWLKV